MSDTPQSASPVPVRDIESRDSELLRAVRSRHGIALDALYKDKPFAADATGQFLTTLTESCEQFRFSEPPTGLLDTQLLAFIKEFAPFQHACVEVVEAIARSDRAAEHLAPLRDFLERLLALKYAPLDATPEAHLSADAFKLIARELFMLTTTVLLHYQRHAEVAALLDRRYRIPDHADRSFVAFDGYVQALDEFRNRRLALSRLSVSTDLLRERARWPAAGFNEVMQADLVLCLRSLLCEDDYFDRWYPRTLVYAEQFLVTGFDLFVETSDPARFGPLRTLFQVDDRQSLIKTLETQIRRFHLEQWEQSGAPVDLMGFVGARNPALRKAGGR